MHQSRRSSLARGLAAASVAIFVALMAHVTAGGVMPGPLGVVVPWVLSAMICVLLAGRRLSLLRLGLAVTTSQSLFHVLFVLGMLTPSLSGSGHVHGSIAMIPAGPAVSEAMIADGGMWLGHLVAAVLTTAVLHRGERVLRSVGELAVRSVAWLRRLLVSALVRPQTLPSARLAVSAVMVELCSALLLSPLRGRAPPRLLTV